MYKFKDKTPIGFDGQIWESKKYNIKITISGTYLAIFGEHSDYKSIFEYAIKNNKKEINFFSYSCNLLEKF